MVVGADGPGAGAAAPADADGGGRGDGGRGPGRSRARAALATALGELLTPAPRREPDPLAEPAAGGAAAAAAADGEHDEEDGEQHDGDDDGFEMPAGEGRLLLKAGPGMEAAEGYEGRPASRRAFFADAAEEAEEEDAAAAAAGRAAVAAAMARKRPRGAAAAEDREFEAWRRAMEAQAGAEAGRGGDALEAEYARMQAEEEGAAPAPALRKADQDRRKGRAVQSQTRLWEKALELRIRLQKCLAGANRMPQGSHARAVERSSEATRAAYEALRLAAGSTLQQMVELQAALMRTEVEAAGAVGAAAAPSAAAWKALQRLDRKLVPFCTGAIDKWHRRTMLATGVGAAKGGLKVLTQSVSSQVAALLRDSDKVLKRMRVRSSEARVFCQPPFEAGGAAADGGAGGAARPAAAEYDHETYDDAEFYNQLLKEFLESKQLDAGNLTAGRGPKRRKVVDRRASKGRKLRYNVHEKLVNFMVPVPHERTSAAVDQLFSGLFGGNAR